MRDRGQSQRMPSRALDGSHGQQDHALFFRWHSAQHHCVMFNINPTVLSVQYTFFYIGIGFI